MAADAPAPSPAAPAGPDSGAPAPASRGFARRHWGKLALLLLFGLPVAGLIAWSSIALSYTYSEGTRTGFVQKLSRKGWICKTWEGELSMSTVAGVSPEIFTFTIRDDSLAAALTNDMGRGRMALAYAEHRGVPMRCFGDTPYFVVSYQLLSPVDPVLTP